jgi:SNF2 family DNA or RNA helicase
MFGSIRNMFGNIKVTQSDKCITVDGVPADVIDKDISKIWNTNKISSYMFIKISKYSFSFPLFFAPDILYALDTMISHRKTNSDIRTLNKIKDRLLESTWLFDTLNNDTQRLDLNKLSEMTYQPLPFQMEFFKYYSNTLDRYNLRGALLAGAAGSGKTYMSLATAHCLKADKVVIICPKNATLRVWEANVLEVFKEPQTYWVSQLDKPYKNERFIIAHYEALEKVHDLLAKIGNGKLCIILDESHNLNEISTARTKLFIELCSKTRCNDVILASGTPIKALGSESIPLFRVIDPFFDDDAEYRFKKIYGKDASRGLDILKHRLGIVSFKVEKKELNLAPPIIETINISIPNFQQYTLSEIARDMKTYTAERLQFFAGTKKEDEQYFYDILEEYKNSIGRDKKGHDDYDKYREFLTRVIKAYTSGDLRNVKDELMYCNQFENKIIIPTLSSEDKVKFKSVKTIVKYVGLKIQGECLGRVLGRKRIQCHIDMIPFIDFKSICNSTLKKTVIFTSFVEALEECSRYLKTKELLPLVVYGKTNSELADTVKRFENDESLNPLIATYNSLSTAVPLIMADTMIMLNAPFRAYIQEQAIARIHRLGADTQTYVYMVNLDTGKEINISTRSIDILAWSTSQVEKIMGIVSPYQIEENVNLENLVEKPLVSISTEEFDIDESVTLESLGLKSSNPSFLKW